jgi:uncharacterized protein (DUF1501 family)
MATRRDFLKSALAASAAAAWTMLPVGHAGWAFAAGDALTARRRLIVIFLRGAVDGLSVVVPYGDQSYYDMRPRIAIAKPGQPGGALDLDGHFGLHPVLAPLLPLWQARSLAFIHASGSPDPSRSHFDAQDYMESATPGIKRTEAGWMNRLLEALPGSLAPNAAVSVGETIPRILEGRIAVANLELGNGAARPQPVDQPKIGSAFDAMYQQGNDAMSLAYREGRAARRSLLGDLMAEDEEQKAANAGAPLPNGFARDASQLGHLIRRDPGIQLAFLALGGWDTHVNQGAAQGQLANRLKPLAEGLATLARELGPTFADTTIVVMSEFGRTLEENGNGGTDHGHGNVMWVLGGRVRGAKVYGQWPGLEPEHRFQGRDLAVTTDFRHVLATVLRDHLGLQPAQLAQVLPELPASGAGLERLIARV